MRSLVNPLLTIGRVVSNLKRAILLLSLVEVLFSVDVG
jgi:hypothetical protein